MTLPNPYGAAEIQNTQVPNELSTPNSFKELWELLYAICSRNCTLLVGIDLGMSVCSEGKNDSPFYQQRLFTFIISWCIQEKLITPIAVIKDLYRLAHENRWLQAGYKIEEYVVEKSQRQQYLKNMLPEVKVVYPKAIAFTAPPETVPEIYAGENRATHSSQNLQYALQQQTRPVGNIKAPISIFIAYARRDIARLNQLELWLTLLKNQQGLNIFWVSCEITEHWKLDIKDPLNALDLILLLFSPEFLASGYCNTPEMECAVNRHSQGNAWVSPVLLRPCIWNENLFGELPFLPTNRISIAKWPKSDDAFYNIATDIARAIKHLEARRA